MIEYNIFKKDLTNLNKYDIIYYNPEREIYKKGRFN